MPVDVVRGLGEAAVRAHAGQEDVASVWSAWSFDLPLLVPVALAGFLYLRGMRRGPGRARRHPRWHTVSYFAGLATLVLALQSPLDYLGAHHFTFHMMQHELLLMVATPLILLGAPTTPLLRGLPPVGRHVVRRLAGSPAVRALYGVVTHPVVAVAFLTVMLWAWHLIPGWYETALRDELVHDLQHSSYVVAGALFWWAVIDPAPLRSRLPYVVRIAYIFIGSTPKHFLGALITFTGEPLYDVYVAARPIVGISPETDQEIAGLLMWAPSQMMHLIAMAIVFFVWANRAERDQRERDDERLARAAASGGAEPPGEPPEVRY